MDYDIVVRKIENRYTITIDGSAPFSYDCREVELEDCIRESIATYEGVAEVRRNLDRGIW